MGPRGRIVTGCALPSSPKPVEYINRPRLETISSFWTQRAHGAAFGELGGTRCVPAHEPCAHHGRSEQLHRQAGRGFRGQMPSCSLTRTHCSAKGKSDSASRIFPGVLEASPPPHATSPGWNRVLHGWVGLRGPGLPRQQGGAWGRGCVGMACPPRLGLPKGVGWGVPGSAGTHTTPQAPVTSCDNRPTIPWAPGTAEIRGECVCKTRRLCRLAPDPQGWLRATSCVV